MNLLVIILLALLAGPAIYLVLKAKAQKATRAKRMALPGGEARAALTEDLVGRTAEVASDRLDAHRGQVRLVADDRRVRIIEARLADDPGSLPRGEEVLIIESPRPGHPAIVVPADLPALDGP